MLLVVKAHAVDESLQWQQTDKKQVKKIHELIKSIRRSPFEGIGKPEALKFDLAGFWSRRKGQEHRLVYKIKEQEIVVISCRYHYDG